MKGVLDIEFVLSVFLFLGTISFVTVLIGRESVALQNSAISDNMKSESYQISQILMFDKGSPADWENGPKENIKRVGLSSGENYFLDADKLAMMDALCSSDYNFVSGMLTKFHVNIAIKSTNGNVLYNCEPSFETAKRPKFVTERKALLNNEVVEITVTLIG